MSAAWVFRTLSPFRAFCTLISNLYVGRAPIEADVGCNKQRNYEAITNRILLQLRTQAISRERPTRERYDDSVVCPGKKEKDAHYRACYR
ncbi:hypothetical protein F4820DRAFT_8227 [Hypoxylon rubiginosum]|uniref:Uncharacterized protein n=1 Tax=Hypoxylon rubiginosum TaxID=110542 RepID=A0ACB9ZIQ6_9PEZI|nr:hypothetical protein F4820DRAFT_8227 [Hypoxylon rubiginosum]